MLKDIKLIRSLVKSGLMYKTLIIITGLFLSIGLLMELGQILSLGGTSILGDIYMLLPPLYISQILESHEVSAFYRTSPKRKSFETFTKPVLLFILMFISYLIITVFKLIGYRVALDETVAANISGSLLIAGLAGLVLQLYSGFVYKKYIIGIVVLLLTFIPLFTVLNTNLLINQFDNDMGFGVSFALGLLELLAGAGIDIMLKRILYRKQPDPLAFRNALAKNSK